MNFVRCGPSYNVHQNLRLLGKAYWHCAQGRRSRARVYNTQELSITPFTTHPRHCLSYGESHKSLA